MNQDDKISRKTKVLKMLGELIEKRDALSLKFMVARRDLDDVSKQIGELNNELQQVKATVSLMN